MIVSVSSFVSCIMDGRDNSHLVERSLMILSCSGGRFKTWVLDVDLTQDFLKFCAKKSSKSITSFALSEARSWLTQTLVDTKISFGTV